MSNQFYTESQAEQFEQAAYDAAIGEAGKEWERQRDESDFREHELQMRVAYLEAMVGRLIEAIGGYFFGVEHPASIWRKKISDLVAEWEKRDK